MIINLQLFADGPGGEKTEKATTKKREDARKKGDVLKSVDVVSAFMLLFAYFAVRGFGGWMYEHASLFATRVMSVYILDGDSYTLNGLLRIFIDAILTFVICIGPILAVVFVAAIALNVAQVGFQFTTEPIMFKPNKINPISGFKRMFSLKSVVKLLQSLFKIVIIGMLTYVYISKRINSLMMLMGTADIYTIAVKGLEFVFDLMFQIIMAMLILAFFDYAYQWWQHEKDLKMTKQEVKEEFKQMEGDPKVKSKIKEKQRQMSMQRMMSEVPKADVVITNPTHYAVALRYDLEIADAPVVIAKGQDYIAYRIKQIARDNDVEIVENKPLARSLYDGAEIGGKIPVELYQAVAEVLAFVYNLKNKKIV
ncbi:MAG: flagellar biosynthesis protein FlhB [Oscillospiraceae bacterium]|nr:flagellar biosynthesis protein FlhB [Oscillospiraceae bacterium]